MSDIDDSEGVLHERMEDSLDNVEADMYVDSEDVVGDIEKEEIAPDVLKESEIVGYRQQPGKLPFSKPGSGGKNRFSKPTDQSMIPESEGGSLAQPWGSHRHDGLVSGQVIGKPTSLVDSNWKVTGQAKYGDDVRLPGEIIGRILRSPHHYARVLSIDVSKAMELSLIHI